MKFFLSIIILFYGFSVNSQNPNIIVLMYHRFDEERYKDTSISSKTFKNHINYLVENNFQILELIELVDFMDGKKSLPDKSVFITIDDAYKSFYNYGLPILSELKLPFSVFISSDYISSDQNSDYMSWEMLRDITNQNGLILNHSKSHNSLLHSEQHEIIQDIVENQNAIDKNLGKQPKIFSYPFGESSIKVENIIKQLDYSLALSQHSAPISRDENRFRLPRYALNDQFGEMKRFKSILKTKPLQILEINIADATVNSENIELKFKSNYPSKLINCFINNSARMDKQKNQSNEVKLTIKNLKLMQRYRINCTYIKSASEILWFGKMFKRIN